ncbi:hypothetical protein KCU88_g5531, partial [Aureobasidium melanogenum]
MNDLRLGQCLGTPSEQHHIHASKVHGARCARCAQEPNAPVYASVRVWIWICIFQDRAPSWRQLPGHRPRLRSIPVFWRGRLHDPGMGSREERNPDLQFPTSSVLDPWVGSSGTHARLDIYLDLPVRPDADDLTEHELRQDAQGNVHHAHIAGASAYVRPRLPAIHALHVDGGRCIALDRRGHRSPSSAAARPTNGIINSLSIRAQRSRVHGIMVTQEIVPAGVRVRRRPDFDDAVGVVGEFPSTGAGARPELLDFHAVAHNGPVTSVQWTPSGDRLVTTGHDQRIRVWDTCTGRNELVHFGPRIRNERHGELKPLISPLGTHRPGHESLFWPNDDGRGVIFQHHLREGHLLKSLRTQGIKLAEIQAAAAAKSRGGGGGGGRARGRGGGAGGGGSSSLGRLTSGGRINAMVWRFNAPAGDAIEMYTAHGDGSICAWMPRPAGTVDQDEEAEADADVGQIEPPPAPASTLPPQPAPADAEEDADRRRKRKRELMADLVEGLARRPMRFS